MSGKQTIFWKVMEGQSVVVPIIQRDYAQGRRDPSTSQIRTEFISAIVEAVSENKAGSLDLGLIYGFLESGWAYPRLVLLDGQQRMTTLFLLHWLVARRSGWSDELPNTFRRFTYETRSTARDFCKALADEKLEVPVGGLVSDCIKDARWFFRSWETDPTISGMLVVLDELHRKLDGFDPVRIWAALISSESPPIHFQFLSMADVGLTDDLYIKMNARGRQLTEYEKFKAWLEQHTDNQGMKFGRVSWQTSLDKEWTDLFWKKRTKGLTEIDTPLLRFFRSVSLGHFVATTEGKDVHSLIEKVQLQAFVPNHELESLFSEETLMNVFTTLDRFCGGGLEEIVQCLNPLRFFGEFDLLGFCFHERVAGSGQERITYPARVYFYALCCFISAEGWNTEAFGFRRWMRVIRNLVTNSSIERNEYVRAVRSIGPMGAAAYQNVFSYLVDNGVKGFSGFLLVQIQEEVLKAKFVLSDPKWEPALENAENHDLLRGRVGVLLENLSESEITKFADRWVVMNRLFDNKGSAIGKDKHLLIRAVLRRSEPIVLGSQERICLQDSPNNWRTLFSSSSRSCRAFQKGFASLLDALAGRQDLMSSLEEICSCQSTAQELAEENWRSDLVRFGANLLGESSSRKVQNYYGNGVFLYQRSNSCEDDILLGKIAALRNALIQRLLDAPGTLWTIEGGGSEWRRVHAGERLFFKGHRIQLRHNTTICEGVLFLFDYSQLVLRNSAGKQVVEWKFPFPQDGSAKALLSELEAFESTGTGDELLSAARDVFLRCLDGFQK